MTDDLACLQKISSSTNETSERMLTWNARTFLFRARHFIWYSQGKGPQALFPEFLSFMEAQSGIPAYQDLRPAKLRGRTRNSERSFQRANDRLKFPGPDPKFPNSIHYSQGQGSFPDAGGGPEEKRPEIELKL
jgi:hypothetical protein